MDNITIKVSVDLASPTVRQINLGLLAVPSDNQAHTFRFEILKNGSAASVSGASLYLYVQKADGNVVQISGGTVPASGIVSVTMSSACYAVKGPTRAIARLVYSTQKISIADFSWITQGDVYGNASIPAAYKPTIEDLEGYIDRLEPYATQFESISADISDKFDQLSTNKELTSFGVDTGKVIATTNKWASGGGSYLIPVSNAVASVELILGSTSQSAYAWLKTDSTTGTASYATGSELKTYTQNETTRKPSDAKYLYIQSLTTGGANRQPEKVILKGGLSVVDELNDRSLNLYYHRNIWDVVDSESGAIIDASNGMADKRSAYSSYITSDYIPVNVGDVLYGYGARYALFDADKTYIANYKLSDGISMRNGMTYVRIKDIEKDGTSVTPAYLRISYKTDSGSPKELYLADLFTVEAFGAVRGKSGIKYYSIGDSITRGMYAEIGTKSASGPTDKGYAFWIAETNGYDLVNLGVSGSGYANLGGNNTGAEDESGSTNGKTIVDSNTCSDADIITIAYGVNDYKSSDSSIKLGSMASTSGGGTVIGNMKYMIEKLAANAPKAQIIILLPMNQNRVNASSMSLAGNWSMGYAVREGKTLADYRTAIRECAEYYNLRVVDLEEICAINRINIKSCLGDGLHPTLDFHRRMGIALAPYIR